MRRAGRIAGVLIGLALALLVVVPASGQDLNTLLTNFLVDLRNGTFGVRSPISSMALSGALTFTPDNTYDIGASGATRPRSLFLAQNITAGGAIAASGDINSAATALFYWAGRGVLKSPADGAVAITNNAQTIGSELKADALPTIASGFGASPTIAAGSTPLAGAIVVSTGGPLTGVVNFNGTAFPSAPFVLCMNASTAAVLRCGSSTTQLTVTAPVAFTAGDVVSWIAISSK